MANDPVSDSPQVAAQIRQLVAERENAVVYGNETRIAAVDKQLAGLGYKPDKSPSGKAEEETRSEPPKGRSARSRSTAEG